MALDTSTISKALELSPEDRAELARHLLLSLEEDDYDKDAEQAWGEEIDRRLEHADRTNAADWATVLQRVRTSLRRNHNK